MKISTLIEYLNQIKKSNGDIEVTCVGCLASEWTDADGRGAVLDKPFETTVEHVEVHFDDPKWGTRVRLLM